MTEASSAPSLVRTAFERLSQGPVHTLDLARDVLGLRGNPGAVSAAVFQLLGADARFRVDAEGVWSLDASAPDPGPDLADLRFAVVDVETTGGPFGNGHRITELAVVEVYGGRIVDEYRTLVNPGRRIPPTVSALTGITDAMVADAPYFDHVADEVLRRLRGRVFVAHNVAFDWHFVSAELLNAVGEAPDIPRLCTVRMVRRLVPAVRRRNLDVVARYFGVEIQGRHRAYGDALATARIFLRLLDEAAGRGIHDLDSLDRVLRRRGRARRADPSQTALPLRAKRPKKRTGGDP